MDLKFGTSGLRGLASDLAGKPAGIYAAAFARHLLASGHAKLGDAIFVAQDQRPSSPQIADLCMRALAGEGLKPVYCQYLPTPALAHYAMGRGAAALMVTGSHIPADRNGIKFYRPDGEIDKDDEAAISALAAGSIEPAIAERDDRDPPWKNAESEARAAYMQRYRKFLPDNALAGMRIGLFEHTSVAGSLLGEIVGAFGAEIVPFGASDVFVPVDTEAVSADALRQIAAAAKDLKLDAVISTDPDGDRPLITDENGEQLRGDLAGLAAAVYLGATTIVTPVTSNSGLSSVDDIEVVRTRVGSPYVIAEMAACVARGSGDRVIGFEANGGALLATPFTLNGATIDALPTRDSAVPILSVLGLAARRGISVSQLRDVWDFPVVVSDRVEDYAQERSGRLMAALSGDADFRASFLAPLGDVGSVDETDGLRVTLTSGEIVHFRPSGNAPEMRCYCEAKSESLARAMLAEGMALIAAFE